MLGMCAVNDYPPRTPAAPRTAMLTFIMLAILAGSLGAAWLLSATRGAAANEAAAILAQIRTRRLSSYWPEESYRECFVFRDASGQVRGGRQTWWSQAHDEYQGHTVMVTQYIAREDWWVGDDASSGQYDSRESTHNLRTRITLAKGQVTVAQAIEEGTQSAQTPLPANYIPEGLMPLAVAQVAKRGKPASFRMIFDQEAIVEDKVTFVLARMVPQDSNTVKVAYSGPEGSTSEVIHLDAAGRIESIQREDNTEFRVTSEELLRLVPAIGRLLPGEPEEQGTGTDHPVERIPPGRGSPDVTFPI